MLSGYLLSIRNDTIQSLMNFMASRLKLGDDLQSSSSSVRAFCNFTATSEDIRAVWKLFVPDVVLAQECEDIQALSPKPTYPRQVLRMICSSKYPSPSSLARSTTLARILVCKPQRTPDISIQSSKVVAEKQFGACDYRQLSVNP